MSDIQTAEMLWARAHELVKKGDFASAVRDLAACFQTLQALGDPRVYEVHKRWTEVHQMYLEDGARQAAEPQAQVTTSIEAEAEAAANSGDLETALELYQNAAQQNPQNELVRERIAELTAAIRRAEELARGKAAPTTEPAPQAAPAMSPDDAPVGMQSLDVPFSVGEAIDSFQADELPVEGAATAPPAEAASVDVDFDQVPEEPVERTAMFADVDGYEAERQRRAAAEAERAAAAEKAAAETAAAETAAAEKAAAEKAAAEAAQIAAVERAALAAASHWEQMQAAAAQTAPEASFSLEEDHVEAAPAVDLEAENAKVADVAFLEELLARVQANRRHAS